MSAQSAENDAPCGCKVGGLHRYACGLVGHVDPPRRSAESGLRDALVKVLIAEGAGPGNSIHSWRCEHPARYGECSCVVEIADELMKVIPPAEKGEAGD